MARTKLSNGHGRPTAGGERRHGRQEERDGGRRNIYEGEWKAGRKGWREAIYEGEQETVMMQIITIITG